MTTLLLSTWKLPAAEALAEAARRRGWKVVDLASAEPPVDGEMVFYGGSDVVDQVAAQFDLALLEPPFDLLVRTPVEFVSRSVGCARYEELEPFDQPMFAKPADVRRKAFDAGIYRDVRDARLETVLDPRMPVLLSEPVEWLEEHRCFVLNGQIAATSPYLRFGRPAWQPYEKRAECSLPAGAREFCERLLNQRELPLPPAFVVDVGLIHGRGWAIVEYNPAWCSSLLGGEPAKVLPVLARASVSRVRLAAEDEPWLAGDVAPTVDASFAMPSLPVFAHAGAMT